MTNQKKAFAATIGCLLFMIFGFIFDRFSLTITPLFYISAIIIGGYKQTSEGLKELWNDQDTECGFIDGFSCYWCLFDR